MSSFWPNGLELSDTQSPRDILNTANKDWQTNSNGILELILQDAESESGNPMIIVHAKHMTNEQTATLFSIVHQPKKPYPVAIQLEKEDLPTFLKKSYSQLNLGNHYAALLRPQQESSGQALNQLGQVLNQWVSDTPSEFRKKLSEAFNLGIVKREILNLASSAIDKANDTSEDSADDNF